MSQLENGVFVICAIAQHNVNTWRHNAAGDQRMKNFFVSSSVETVGFAEMSLCDTNNGMKLIFYMLCDIVTLTTNVSTL